jgi:tRNA(Ile)-lysidine synthase
LSIEISDETLGYLQGSKNLLAFSGGVDSSALFHILLENGISFDMAIIDYNLREQSKDEVSYAKHLAKHFEKSLFIGSVSMDKFSEGEARDVRYKFFRDLIDQNGYSNLITAHQLNDKLEWFFMQFSKGAGLLELTGMSEFEVRDGYRLLRPLIDVSKDELLEYLEEREIRYFIDSSNFDERFKRNYFRHNFSNRFLSEFKDGVLNSFSYLEEDRAIFMRGGVDISSEGKLFYFKRTVSERVDIFYVDKILKRNGYVLSSKQREEIIKDREVVVGGEWVVALSSTVVFVAPYEQTTVMPKGFKEMCRRKRIPSLLRPYLYSIKSSLCLT